MACCDLCGNQVTETTHIPIEEFQQVVRAGFNPFANPDIDTSGATGPAEMFGMSVDTVFQDWRGNVMSDTTAWGLCSTCLPAYRAATGTGD